MISTLTHPEYLASTDLWHKWRLTYQGGSSFVTQYLKQYTARETEDDFNLRKTITYCPAFAKAAINDIKNSIFQRIADVTRDGGPKSYLDACLGLSNGVDLHGSTMNAFIGREILIELLTMGRVGIFVDRAPLNNPVTINKVTSSPYIYAYKTENIRSWAFNETNTLKAVLLRDYNYSFSSDGLPEKYEERYRLIDFDSNGFVRVRIFNSEKESTVLSKTTLKIRKIPFVILGLSDSLLTDVADYQIALLNMESSDISYILKANFPFYTEQTDSRASGNHLKKSDTTEATDDNVEVGAVHGRKYPKGLERPGFIAPPTEPLSASMLKAQQLKDDIRLLVNLSLSNVKPKMASAESKGMDERGLEAGLSYVGLELEHAERQIATIWAEYEGLKDVTTVSYPKRYSLKTDKDKQDEAKSLEDRMKSIPSNTYKKEIAKQIVHTMLDGKVSIEKIKAIDAEIDNAQILTTDPETVKMAVEAAILSNKGAAQALGIPETEIDQAKQDHADRAARIAAAQSSVAMAARGVKDLSPDTDASKEKKANDTLR